MDHKKHITSKENQDILKLLSDGSTTLEIMKTLNNQNKVTNIGEIGRQKL